ncbi:hypothetical protein E2C01_023042 [Portunus trituberculatus]|uniref:Uncharacterized protein n=1 Tax=Portunus trituberculatus TaxID=210409 RepID=A0A5B7E700_PORTR|nr:hypothetical protein [Portunus trituberculatus]
MQFDGCIDHLSSLWTLKNIGHKIYILKRLLFQLHGRQNTRKIVAKVDLHKEPRAAYPSSPNPTSPSPTLPSSLCPPTSQPSLPRQHIKVP